MLPEYLSDVNMCVWYKLLNEKTMRKVLRKSMHWICLFALVAMVACSKDDKGPKTSPLSPEEHKAKLEEKGLAFVQAINVKEQETAVQAMKTLAGLVQDESLNDIIQDLIDQVSNVAATNSLPGLMALAMDQKLYKLSDFYGKYVYNQGTWTRTDLDGKAEFHYPEGTKPAILSITSTPSQETIPNEEGGFDIQLPASIDMKLTVNGQEELNFKLEIRLNSSAKTAGVTAKLTIARKYTWSVKSDIAASKAVMEGSMTVGDNSLISLSTTLNGAGLNDPESDNTALHSAVADITISGIRAKGNANIKAISEYEDELDDAIDKAGRWDMNEQEAKGLADAYNRNMKVELYYSDEDAKIADMVMAAFLDYKVYYIEPRLKFASDGSEITLDDYFADQASFKDLLDAAEKLYEQYMRLLEL